MTNTIDPLKLHYKNILSVTLPVTFGVFVQFIVVFTDNYFVAQLNGNAMSGASFVGLIYVSLTMLGVGLGNATQILVARRKGEGLYNDIGSVVSDSIWMAAVLACIQFLLLYYIIPLLLPMFIKSEAVRIYMEQFISYRAFGFFFSTIGLVLTSFWTGIAQTRVMIYTTLITAFVNIILDYLLVFGHFGFPEMGVRGAAFATAIAEGSALVYLLYFTLRNYSSAILPNDKNDPSNKTKYHISKYLLKFPTEHALSLFKLGGPISLQLLLSLGIWAIFYGFVENMGEQPLQASFIVRNMYMLAYVSVGGFSMITKTYVSGLIAEKRQPEIISTMKKIILMNLAGVIILSHGMWLYPDWIASRFTSDAIVIGHTVDIMHVVLPAMLVFSITSIMLAMVEGSGNTIAGFIIEMITVIVYVIASFIFVYELKLPIHLVWTTDYIYFVLIGLLSLAYLKNGKWKYKKI